MSRVCQVTGREPGFGHHVSHSHRRTKRRFDVNVQTKRYYVPTLGRTVKLRVSARGIKAAGGGAAPMAKRGSDVRPIIKLRSTAGTGYTYVTKKNRRNDPDRMVLMKYDPRIRRHVQFREER
jgi:ribosomal protein L28/ribosomal protein L33